MEAVESAWLVSLVAGGIAPVAARHPVRGLVGADDIDAVARAAESAGRLLRQLPANSGRSASSA